MNHSKVVFKLNDEFGTAITVKLNDPTDNFYDKVECAIEQAKITRSELSHAKAISYDEWGDCRTFHFDEDGHDYFENYKQFNQRRNDYE